MAPKLKLGVCVVPEGAGVGADAGAGVGEALAPLFAVPKLNFRPPLDGAGAAAGCVAGASVGDERAEGCPKPNVEGLEAATGLLSEEALDAAGCPRRENNELVLGDGAGAEASGFPNPPNADTGAGPSAFFSPVVFVAAGAPKENFGGCLGAGAADTGRAGAPPNRALPLLKVGGGVAAAAAAAAAALTGGLPKPSLAGSSTGLGAARGGAAANKVGLFDAAGAASPEG